MLVFKGGKNIYIYIFKPNPLHGNIKQSKSMNINHMGRAIYR